MEKRMSAPLDQIPSALAKTGFILEHRVSEQFKSQGWSTIGGRYYADDVDGRARELDLVAYKTQTSEDLNVVSAVLVSCKKDEERTWAFMTRRKPKADPNFDWDPVHFWTDVQPLQVYLASDSWRDEYLASGGKNYQENFKAVRDIFAFQQISTSKVTAQNDKDIFDSIVSLMKALDHEVEVVPARAKKRKRIYLFHLLSVVDAAMVDVDYAEKDPAATEVKQMTHLARYMVRRRELSALVHFVRSDALPGFVSAISKLADCNAKHMISLSGKAYAAIRWNEKVREYFAEKMKSYILLRISQSLARVKKDEKKIGYMEFNFKNNKLEIVVSIFDDESLDHINGDEKLRAEVSDYLKKMARYEGDFSFEFDVPF